MPFKTGTDLVNEAKQRIREYTPREVLEMLEKGAAVIYLDVREPNEWNLGHLPNAMHIPRGNLEPGPDFVLFSLAKGATSDPVDSPRGFLIFKRIE